MGPVEYPSSVGPVTITVGLSHGYYPFQARLCTYFGSSGPKTLYRFPRKKGTTGAGLCRDLWDTDSISTWEMPLIHRFGSTRKGG
jgi:hypothetical protein